MKLSAKGPGRTNGKPASSSQKDKEGEEAEEEPAKGNQKKKATQTKGKSPAASKASARKKPLAVQPVDNESLESPDLEAGSSRSKTNKGKGTSNAQSH